MAGHSHASHDDHDAHGHGHGGHAPSFPIIPEDSSADRFLKMLAGFTLVGLFVFAAIMVRTPIHHEGEHPKAEDTFPHSLTEPGLDSSSGSHGGSPQSSEHH